MYYRERQRHYGGWGVLNAVVGSATMAGGVCEMLWSEAATATVQVPDWCDATAVPLLCASEVCCVVVVLLWTAALIVLVYARGTYALSK